MFMGHLHTGDVWLVYSSNFADILYQPIVLSTIITRSFVLVLVLSVLFSS